jgi:two-component system OmpR family sensor kinase
MKLRTRLGVAAGLVLVVLVAAGVLLPRSVRGAQIEQVDSQLRSALPGTMGLLPGPERRGRPPDVAQAIEPDGTPLTGDESSATTTVPEETGPVVLTPGGVGDGSPSPSPTPTDSDSDDSTDGEEQPQLFNTTLSDIYVALIDDGARDVRLSSPVAEGREPALPTATSALGDPAMVTVESLEGDGEWRAMLLTMPTGDQVLVAVPLDRVDATAQRLTAAIVVAAAAVLLALVAAGWWLLRLGLRPIAEVTQVADAIAQGDRTRRVVGGASGRRFRRRSRGRGEARTEADQLARAFNVMLDEQAATEMQLRQFVADASHELRTPVAAIRGFADLWRAGALGEDQLDDVMRRIGQESTRMRGLVEDLLLLARLDQGRVLAVEPVDLSALAADAVLDASATHPSRTVRLEAPSPTMVTGDEARLRQVVSNLVSNALVHTTATTTVVIRAEPCRSGGDGDTARLAVSDDGPGMDAEASARAFDRFWRGDPGRARGGAGLGLSIVRSIVAAHHGDVVLDSTPGAGTTVEVVLPAAPRHAAPSPPPAEADRAGSYV